MTRPTDPNQSYSAIGQFIHDQGFQAIGGLVLTSRYFPKSGWTFSLQCDKDRREKLTFGHEQTLDIFTAQTGVNTYVARTRGNIPIDVLKPGDDWIRNITPEEYAEAYVAPFSTRKPK